MEKNDRIIRLLCSILQEIADATTEMDTEETECGTLHFTELRYTPVFPFTDDDIQLIKEIADSEDEDFSQLTD